MNVFDLRQRLVDDYADYTRSFVVIRDERIRERVDRELGEGLLWPQPIVQLNPACEFWPSRSPACRWLSCVLLGELGHRGFPRFGTRSGHGSQGCHRLLMHPKTQEIEPATSGLQSR